MLGDLNNMDFLSPPVLLSAEDLDRQKLLDDWNGQLARVANAIAVQRGYLKTQEQGLRQLTRETRHPNVRAEVVYAIAEEAEKLEARFANRTKPHINAIAAILGEIEKSGSDDRIARTIRRYAEETLDVLVSWLELVQNHRIEFLRIASEKGAARPVISTAEELERELASLAEDAG